MRRALVALAFVVVALQAEAGSRQKIAVLDVKSVQGVSPGTATILTSIIAGDTARAGFDVLSQSDITALIGFERQKKMLGCGDDSSCLAEIGGALGAQYVLYTQVGQIGSRFHVSLQLLDASKGVVVGRVSTFSKTNEDALAETAERAVAEVLAAVPTSRAAAARASPSGPVRESRATSVRAPAKQPAVAQPSQTAAGAKAGALAAAGTWWGSNRLYLEARFAKGWPKLRLLHRNQPGSDSAGGFTVKAGFRWRPEWALELGAGFENFEAEEFTVRRLSVVLSSEVAFGAGAEASAQFVSFGAAWSPRGNRYFSVAADLGLAWIRHNYWEWTLPDNTYGSVVLADPAKARSVAPRVGAELRLDYPIRWGLGVGLRLGVTATGNGARGETNWYDGTLARSVTWLDPGWIVEWPSASVTFRYGF